MIALSGVTKEFGGRLGRARGRGVRALDGITLDIQPGAALGVAGPNGAGKSTLLRLLLGYLRPSDGTVTVGGVAPREYVERHGIAYVSETIAIPPHWTVHETLHAFAALAEVDDERARVARLLEQLGLAGQTGRRVDELSKGNLQRLALAQALLAPRRVMILDEPSHGLDPEWTERLHALVAAWRAEDPQRVLLLASHDLGGMERMVERVAVLHEGRLCATLDASVPPAVRLDADSTLDRVRAAFPGIQAAGGDGVFRLQGGEPAALSAGLGRLATSGAVVRGFALEPSPLEARVRAALLAAGGGA